MKAFLSAIAAVIVISGTTWLIASQRLQTTTMDEFSSSPSVRIDAHH